MERKDGASWVDDEQSKRCSAATLRHMVFVVLLVLVSLLVLHSAAVVSWSFSLEPFMPACFHQCQNFVQD
jgi:hypothetical protein